MALCSLCLRRNHNNTTICDRCDQRMADRDLPDPEPEPCWGPPLDAIDHDCDVCGRPVTVPGLCRRCDNEDRTIIGEAW